MTLLAAQDFTRSGQGLKHIERYLLELPKMYEKMLACISLASIEGYRSNAVSKSI